MTVWQRLRRALPLLRISQQCESCGQNFSCEIGVGGCWCGTVRISDRTRAALEARFRRCLCRSCIEGAEAQYNPAPDDATPDA